MSFTISKSDFFDLLQKTSPFAPLKSSLQILSNIKIVLNDNSISVMATDLDHSIEVQKTINGSGSYTIAVNARKLFDIVREMPNENIEINIDENVFIMSAQSGFSCKIAGVDASDYPAFPEIDSAQKIGVKLENISKMVERSAFAVAKDSSRACLCGILCEVNAEKISMVATDGHRLGYCSIEGNFPTEQSLSAIISPKSLIHVTRILADHAADEVQIGFSERYVTFSHGSVFICSKLLDGPYPDYEKVIPSHNPKVAVISRTDLIEAVRRVSILSNQKTHLVRFAFSQNNLEVVVLNRDIGGEARELLEVTYENEEHVVGFNANYFTEILSLIDSAYIRLEMNTQISACLLFADSEQKAGTKELFLIMPLRIMD